jgi:hypothetical protein
MGLSEMLAAFWLENSAGRESLGDLNVNGRVRLRVHFKQIVCDGGNWI